MGQTVVEKIAQAHMTKGPNRLLKAEDVVSLRPAHLLTHDNSAAVMKKFSGLAAERVFDHRQPVFVLDHDIQNRSSENLAKYESIQNFARQQGIDFYPAGTGIGHQLMVSMGYVQPGRLVVASDSHANMYGALAALGTPVVRSDAAVVWATGEFWWQIPRTVRVTLEGKLAEGISGKDAIITLCGLYSQGEVLNAALEFCGPGVASLSMDARLTMANMTTEWGALTGWFPVDEVTVAYFQGRIDEDEIELWRDCPPRPDADATYAADIVLDLAQVQPHVAGPDTVQVTQPVAEIEETQRPIQKAYLLSCVNSREEDLAAAARVLKGKRIARGVEFYLAAASREVENRARAGGAWQTLLDAGAKPLPAGCGPCIGLGEGLLEAGETAISATNRNFKGRMGSRQASVYLASPQTVAASALAGFICGSNGRRGSGAERRFLPHEVAQVEETVRIEPGFPASLRGRVVFIPQDNLNTDGIYSKDYTYREEMTRAEMARVVMENYDPEFSGRIEPGDILVGGSNFGAGSSREQAATALAARGIALVIAAGFSQTFLRNAYNNGFLCIQCPSLVEAIRRQYADRLTEEVRTFIPGHHLYVDFQVGRILWGEKEFRFAPLGQVAQSLIAAGGIEELVRRRLTVNEVKETARPGIGSAGRRGPEVRSDCYVRVEILESGGITLGVSSKVKALYEESIRQTVVTTLEKLGVTDARVELEDQGALPFVIAARVEGAVRRADPERKGEVKSPLLVPVRPASARGRLRRSRLYLPAGAPKFMVNAGLHRPDAVILDLEDSVHPDDKDLARILVKNALRSVDFGDCERMVRINQLPLGLDDLDIVIPERPELILIPKVEAARDVVAVEQHVAAIQRDCSGEKEIWLMPILESALGLEHAFEIASASESVVALTIGLEDYTADLGVARTRQGDESLWARLRLVNAARAAGIQAIDSVYGDVEDLEGLLNWGRRSRSQGYQGMGCIHPRQIRVIHEAYRPSKEEIERAVRIVAAFEEAEREGRSVVSLGTRMIDPPVVLRARRLVAEAKELGLVPPGEPV